MAEQDLPDRPGDQRDPGDAGSPPPPPPPPPPSGQAAGSACAGADRRFRRDTANGMLGGVAAGLARQFDVDVVWVRLAFVLLAVFANGLGLIAYLAAWIIVPEGDDREAGAAGARTTGSGRTSLTAGRGGAFWAGAGLVAIGGIILLDTLLRPLQARIGWVSTGELLVPLILILIGVLIWRSSRGGPDAASVAQKVERDVERAVGRFERWTDEVEVRAEAWGEELETKAEGWEARMEAKAAARKAARSQHRVAPITFGATLLTLGGVWLLSSLGVPGATLTRALAGALLVLGVGLLVGSVLGRGRGLIVAGLLIAPLVLVASLVPQLPAGLEAVTIGPDGVIVQDGGERLVEAPDDVASLPATYEFGLGSVVLDLRALDRDELARAGTTRIDVEFGIGDLRILLPDDVAVDVRVELGIGQVDLFGRTSGGLGVDVRNSLNGTTAEDGRLELRIEQGIGRVAVTR
jgi:phage shock protein PspC (stress-responsive transcriptional regulator)